MIYKIVKFYLGGELQVVPTAPSGKTLPVKVTSSGDAYVARFVPEMVGRHSVAVSINDQHVIGSPFSCNVYDVDKVIVSGLPGQKNDLHKASSDMSLREAHSAEVGKPVTFSVDAAHAGEGTLELVVSTQHTTIKAEVVACARGLYDVTFVPQTSEDHFVNITFNDMAVLGSPFRCSVVETTQHIQVGTLASVNLPGDHHGLEVSDPHGRTVKYVTNGAKAEFTVGAVGTYRIQILRGHEVVATRTVHVFDMAKIDVINVPEALCHRPAVVGINISKAGPGRLTSTVKVGNRDVAHTVRQSPTNASMWEVVFHPVHTAPHKIRLYYNDVPKLEVLDVSVKVCVGCLLH